MTDQPTDHRHGRRDQAFDAHRAGGDAGRRIVRDALAAAGPDRYHAAARRELLAALRDRTHSLGWRVACAIGALEEAQQVEEET